MAGDPRYLALLDELESTDAREFQALSDLWGDLVWNPRNIDTLTDIAAVCFGYLAEYHRFDKDPFEKAWKDAISDAKQLHIAKNAGYAGADNPDPWANFRMCADFGINPVDGVLTRMSDKYIRILNLQRNPSNERVGEAITDTIRDLAAYALIAICLIEEQEKQAPNRDEIVNTVKELLTGPIDALEIELGSYWMTQEARDALTALKRFRDA